MFENTITGIEEWLEEMHQHLINLQKQAERNLIRNWVARQSIETSTLRKLRVQSKKQTYINELKRDSQSYSEKLSAFAKGQWVDKAKQIVEQTPHSLDSL
ncbi:MULTISPECIES: hypothetical protein [unclassified Enterococcus]|uniref:hypothetical protein n=1 Tax=unclassified Enterococcus TaxID=2608891 RepID=UPI0013EA5F71|nr:MULTISPECIES: hypothetical protein [unclassified Enterococcus]